MLWRWMTTFMVSGQSISLTIRAAAILRSYEGVPAIRSESDCSSAWMLICTWSKPGGLEIFGATPREAEGASDEVGVETQLPGACHDLHEIAALERLATGEVELQNAERPRLGKYPSPLFGIQLFVVVREV